MIRCVMACSPNGCWEVEHLQNIEYKYKENLDVVPVSDSIAIDGDVTESQSK